ncbi:PREDICTED: LOW QUALITY PROTEIN: E3 ubiquitin-protein ligase HERC2-like, partial [Priapulus caudatus]|uniref:Cytochrome b5 n=1 Tax=Priapulus caudatus TaxID=37621 RepID=A0ABM1F4B1_PRICU
ECSVTESLPAAAAVSQPVDRPQTSPATATSAATAATAAAVDLMLSLPRPAAESAAPPGVQASAKMAPPTSLRFANTDADLLGAGSLLRKYVVLVCMHVSDVLPVAASLAAANPKLFSTLATIMQADISGVLLPELVSSLLLLLYKAPSVIQSSKAVLMLGCMLDVLDKFNRLAPGVEREDVEDLAWPGIFNMDVYNPTKAKAPEGICQVRHCDLVNNNRDGGLWVVLHGNVYDMLQFKLDAPCGEETLDDMAGQDVTAAFEAAGHSEEAHAMLKTYTDRGSTSTPPETTGQRESHDTNYASSPLLLDTERMLAVLMGLHASYQAARLKRDTKHRYDTMYSVASSRSRDPKSSSLGGLESECRESASPLATPKAETENRAKENGLETGSRPRRLGRDANMECQRWLCSELFAGGLQLLQPLNPFEEEKGEMIRSSSTTTTPDSTPTEPNVLKLDSKMEDSVRLQPSLGQNIHTDTTAPLLHALAESRLQEPQVKSLLLHMERYCKSHHMTMPIDFPADHSVEEVGRLLLAVLLKHQDLAHVALTLLLELAAAAAAAKQQRRVDMQEHAAHYHQHHGHHHRHAQLPRSLADVCKTVQQCKRSLIKLHQDMSRSYKEVCAPIIERCRFLLFELRPAKGNEGTTVTRLKLLTTLPRWRSVIRKMIHKNRQEKRLSKPDVPEDGVGDSKVAAGLQTEAALAADADTDAGQQQADPDNVEPASPQRRKDKWPPGVSTMSCARQFRWLRQRLGGAPTHSTLISSIVAFVMQEEGVDIEKLRKSLWHQVERASLRKKGVESMLELVNKDYLIRSAKYSLLCGWLGLAGGSVKSEPMPYCLDNVGLIPPHDRIAFGAAVWPGWRRGRESITPAALLHNDNSHTIAVMPCTRFLLLVLCMLSSPHKAHSISLLINSGTLAIIQTVLRLLGPDQDGQVEDKNAGLVCTVLEETRPKPKKQQLPLTGPELAAMMKIGTRVVRGPDWKWGDQLRIINEAQVVVVTREEEERRKQQPTTMARAACLHGLRILAVCTANHAEVAQHEAVYTLCGLLRTLVEANSKQNTSQPSRVVVQQQHREWSTLGFIRSLAASPSICRALSTPRWIELLLGIVGCCRGEVGVAAETLFSQVLTLRLLRVLLPSWEASEEGARMGDLVEKLFHITGNILMSCASDPSLAPLDASRRSKKRFAPARHLTASFSSCVVAEELVCLLRTLHALPAWNDKINDYIVSRLSRLSELLSPQPPCDAPVDEGATSPAGSLPHSLMAILAVVGGVDARPRLGALVQQEEQGVGT